MPWWVVPRKGGMKRNGIVHLSQAERVWVPNSIFLEPDRLKGAEREKIFFLAFQEPRFPSPEWFRGVRWATRKEEMTGPDFFILMTEGVEMPVNVKSSSRGVKNFKKDQRRRSNLKFVIPFVVQEDDTNETIRENLFQRAEKWRAEFLAEILGQGGKNAV